MALNSVIQGKPITLQKEIKRLDGVAQEYNCRSSSNRSSRYSQFPRASDISYVRPTLGLKSYEVDPLLYKYTTIDAIINCQKMGHFKMAVTPPFYTGTSTTRLKVLCTLI